MWALFNNETRYDWNLTRPGCWRECAATAVILAVPVCCLCWRSLQMHTTHDCCTRRMLLTQSTLWAKHAGRLGWAWERSPRKSLWAAEAGFLHVKCPTHSLFELTIILSLLDWHEIATYQNVQTSSIACTVTFQTRQHHQPCSDWTQLFDDRVSRHHPPPPHHHHFWLASLRVHSAPHSQHSPQRLVQSRINCFRQCQVTKLEVVKNCLHSTTWSGASWRSPPVLWCASS